VAAWTESEKRTKNAKFKEFGTKLQYDKRKKNWTVLQLYIKFGLKRKNNKIG